MPGQPREESLAEQTLATPAKRWAREYETIYILRPNVGTEDAEKVSSRVQGVFEQQGGKLTKVDVWGKRKLAYPIGNHGRGIFVYLRFAAFGELVAELERNLRLLEPVMRYQTVRVVDDVDLEAVEVDPAEVDFGEFEPEEDDEFEPTAAEKLGMVDEEAERARAEAREAAEAEAEAEAEEAEGSEDDDAEDDDAEGDDSEESEGSEDESGDDSEESDDDDAEGDESDESDDDSEDDDE
ncbi:MAG: 30S ribosomal protein S6 [Sandaracinus sp.]|nr:30S ribosomal protein S6 [Myxococcales bacterium]MBJ74233.1 30S ribosomal protein S6 [Sandaracinus sp.]